MDPAAEHPRVSRDVPEAHDKTIASTGPGVHRETTTHASLTEGQLVGERYRVVKLIGAGAQGEVWRAEDVEIEGHVVALKILAYRATSDEQREQALRELRMLAAINHPSVVQFKGHGWLGGRLWFAMPWYDGRDLESAMPLDRAEARRVFETLAAGLAAVHAKGLRHQDIKPSNIFLATIPGIEQKMPILLDFGVAAKEGEELVAGSPDYFAPELAAGWPTTANLGPEADVFSLALSLRNVLEPATAPSVGAFDKPSLDERATKPIAAPSRRDLGFLAPQFARWLALDPKKRPTARELVDELAVLTAPEERRRERIRIARRIGPFVVIVLVVVAIGAWLAWRDVTTARHTAAEEAAARDQAASEAQQSAHTAAEAVARATASSQRTDEALRRLDDAETQLGAAEGNAEAMRQARDALRAALDEARSQLAESRSALSETEAQVTSLTTELASTQAQLASTQAQLASTRSELESTRATLATTSTERDSARSDLATTTTQRDEARASLDQANASLSTARSDLDAERTAHASDRDAANTAQAQLDARIQELEARVHSLEAQPAQSPPPSSTAPPPAPPTTP